MAGLILALTLVRLVHDQNKVAPGEQKEEAMTSRKKSLRSRFRQLVAAMTETVWAYGVGVAAARPLPVGHVLSLAEQGLPPVRTDLLPHGAAQHLRRVRQVLRVEQQPAQQPAE
ncbi:hypothetical protein H9X94_17980 [Micromonospora aurantiaca]|nr:hypothetical protein [Micromonospora aurantiaca]